MTNAVLPTASGTIRNFPELAILEVAPTSNDLQSAYAKTTETNRQFLRGVAEFEIPDFGGTILSARLVLHETGGSTATPQAPDEHSLSSYTDVDLTVSVNDFDRATTPVATFETDVNVPDESFEFDVTSLVVPSEGGRLGFRVKLTADPMANDISNRGATFAPSTTPPGISLEIVTAGPSGGTGPLEEAIRAMHLPPGVEASLLAPLAGINENLADGNPNNDHAACAQLGAFLRQVEAKARDAQLTAEQAAQLDELARELSSSIGCGEA